MSTWKINLKEKTATSINGLVFIMTDVKPGEYDGGKKTKYWPLHFVGWFTRY